MQFFWRQDLQPFVAFRWLGAVEGWDVLEDSAGSWGG